MNERGKGFFCLFHIKSLEASGEQNAKKRRKGATRAQEEKKRNTVW